MNIKIQTVDHVALNNRAHIQPTPVLSVLAELKTADPYYVPKQITWH